MVNQETNNIKMYYLKNLEIAKHTVRLLGYGVAGRASSRVWGSAFIGVEVGGLGFLELILYW